MKKWLLAVLVCTLVLTGCSKYKLASDDEDNKGNGETKTVSQAADTALANADGKDLKAQKKPVRVKGIYISGYMAGSQGLSSILDEIDKTEINTVVIDVKNDDGRITFNMDSPTVNEIGASVPYIKDIGALMAALKSRGIYTIARVVAFRDPYLAEQKPDWCLKDADGSVHRDNKGLAWVNPYRKEVWDYLVEVGGKAADVGFDEVQFDYIRFATDSTMSQVVFDPADTKGRSKTDIITEFITYAYDKLSAKGLFVSADVFGTIIGSKVDSEAVGQDYQEMAKHLDYICPMIYPSHYGDGNFGIEHPDTKPYDTILAALQKSREDLTQTKTDGEHQAIVRPWLQDFTASYLKHYITYGAKEVRDQIQAVYDSGYDQWMLWSAANNYTWDGLLTPEAAKEEDQKIAESRAALPPEPQPSTEEKAGEAAAAPAPSDRQNAVPGESKPRAEGDSSPASELQTGEGDTKGDTKAEIKEKADRKEKPPVVIVTTGAGD